MAGSVMTHHPDRRVLRLHPALGDPQRRLHRPQGLTTSTPPITIRHQQQDHQSTTRTGRTPPCSRRHTVLIAAAAVRRCRTVATGSRRHRRHRRAARRPRTVTLSYFTFSAAPDHLEDLDAIIAAFEAEHPNITHRGADRRVRRLLHEPADPGRRRQRTRHVRAQLRELRDLRPQRRPARPHRRRSSIDPARFYPLALEGFQDGGVQYGLPATFSDVVLIYNKDLVRRGRPRLPDRRLDVGGRAGRGRGAHRRRGRRLRRLPAGAASTSSTRRWPRPAARSSTPTARPPSTTPKGVAAAEWLTRQAGHDDADARRHRRHPRLRHGAVQERQAGDVAQRHLAVRRPQRVGRQLRHRRSSRATPARPTPCS